jgi:type 1 glutamine amidotransferase
VKSGSSTAWKVLGSLLACLCLCLAVQAAEPEVPSNAGAVPGVLRVLILSGAGDHDWSSTTPLLRRLLADSGRFDIRVCETPSGITPETLAPFDVVVSDYSGPVWGKSTEKALENFVESGKGLVLGHGTLSTLASQGHPSRATVKESVWPWLAKTARISWTGDSIQDVHAPFQVLEVKAAMEDQPVMNGLRAGLKTGDRPLIHFKLQSGAEVVAKSASGDPLIFISHLGKGRVFCTVLGHDQAAMQEKAFITTFLRGTEWAASGRVTLPPEIGMPGPKLDAVRGLIVTGGHDHYASFYGLFEGYKDLGRFPVSDSKLAFKEDLRGKYDVIVFYDFTRELDDKERQVLRDFVESGKGIVILHHAILNYQKWTWWSEEVAGGRYRLSREGNIPNSTVKFGEEHLITPVSGHPITAGIGPFHVTDETYKGLYISPDIKPLLLTDNPTSDPVVGWVGPCKTSRVVFIQLGHDHTPGQHPSYRALVHNSVLWTAGKLN